MQEEAELASGKIEEPEVQPHASSREVTALYLLRTEDEKLKRFITNPKGILGASKTEVKGAHRCCLYLRLPECPTLGNGEVYALILKSCPRPNAAYK